MLSYILSYSSDTLGFHSMLEKVTIFFFISVSLLSVVLIAFI